MKTRGSAFLLVMASLAVASVVFAITLMRYDVRLSARREQAMRAQSLWLARSAISAGKSGVQRAETPFGTATVKTLRQAGSVEATVELSGQKAKVTFRPNAPQGEKWSETFDFDVATQ